MKRIIKDYILIIIAGMIFPFYSCNKIDLKPISSLTEADFFKTSSDLDLAVIGVYNRYQQIFPRKWTLFEMSTDNIYRSVYITVGGLEQMDLVNYQSSNDIFKNFWQDSYNGIFRANAVLKYLDVPDTYPGSLKDQLEGEAKFMRALFYFDLVRSFGGVPKVTDLLTVSEARNTVRASKEEIYNLIKTDLTSAIEKLPNYSNAAKGRASKEAAIALLGKVYIYTEEWDLADKMLSNIIDKQFGLMDHYGDLWKEQFEDNEEIIFAIKYIANQNGQRLSLDFLPYQGVEGFSGSSGGELALPSWSAMKIFSSEDKRGDATFTKLWRDPNGGNQQYVWRPFISKFISQSAQSSGLDLPVLRYADVLLLKSEACYRVNKIDSSLFFLNKVRARGFEDNSHNYAITDISTPEIFLDKLLLERNLELAYECQRRPDLIRTGRYAQVMQNVEWSFNPQTNTSQLVHIDVKPYQLLYPIPQFEIEVSGSSILEQNPGYN